MRKVYVIWAQIKKTKQTWIVDVYSNFKAANKRRIELIANNAKDRDYTLEVTILKTK